MKTYFNYEDLYRKRSKIIKEIFSTVKDYYSLPQKLILKRKRFSLDPYILGLFSVKENTIVLYGVADKNLSITEIIRTLFHEIGHAICFKFDIFKAYHNLNLKRPKSNEEYAKNLRSFLKTALRAERYVDSLSIKLQKEFAPDYLPSRKLDGYYCKDTSAWFSDEFLAPIREELKIINDKLKIKK